MRTRFKAILLVSTGAMLNLMASGAVAQTVTAAPVQKDQSSGTVEQPDIVVTAQKREQNRLEVPITLAAFDGKFLDKAGVKDLHDLSALTPGFYVQNQSPNNPGIVMRGITEDSLDATDEPRVSIYQDGVSISRSSSAITELFDIQRIEVDKGPQSTLYGRSALTGAIDIIQNKATEKGLDWNLEGEYGNFNYHSVEAMLNIPLSDKFAVRISGRDKHRDGYITNVLGGDALNGEDAHALRVAFNYTSTAVKNDLLLNYEYGNPSATAFKNTTFYPSDPTTGAVLGDLSPWTSAALNNSPVIEGGRKLGIQRHIGSATDIATWRINADWRLTNTMAFRQDKSTEIFDPDGFGFPILTGADATGGSQFSEELRFNFSYTSKFSGFFGGSFFQQNYHDDVPLAFDERALLALLTGTLNRTNPTAGPLSAYTNPYLMAAEVQGLLGSGGLNVSSATALGLANNLQAAHFEESTDFTKTRSYDLFADATWHPLDKLEISAGVRYSYDDKTSSYTSHVTDRSILGGLIGLEQTATKLGLKSASTGNCTIPQVVAANQLCQLLLGMATPGANSVAFPAAIPLFGIIDQPTENNGQTDSSNLTDSGLSWRLTGRYALSNRQSFYATYSRGRRPQVLLALSPASPLSAAIFTPESSETLDNYEVGYKANYPQLHLKFDGAVYLNNYNHFSATVLQGTTFVSQDAGKAQTYGAETQITWTPNAYANFYLSYAYTHGRFGNGILQGNHFRLTPDNALNVGGVLRYPAFGGAFEVLPSFSWKSKYFFNDDNGNPADQNYIIKNLQFNQYQNAYGLVDLRVAYVAPKGFWRLEFFVTNLTNQKYLKDDGNTGSELGLPTSIPGEPRFYGVTLSLHK